MIGVEGYIDFFGHCPNLGGWLFGGWINNGPAVPLQAHASFAKGGSALVSLTPYFRADVAQFGTGLLGFVEGADSAPTFDMMVLDEGAIVLRSSADAQYLSELDAINATRQLSQSDPAAAVSRLSMLVSRPIYAGRDTLGELPRPVMMAMDEVIVAPGAGVYLDGWLLDPTRAVRSIILRSSQVVSTPLSEIWISYTRPDIVEAFGGSFDLPHGEWGFQTFAAAPVREGSDMYLEVELHDGSVAFKPVPPATSSGRAAIMRILSKVRPEPEVLAALCEKMLAPAVISLNRERLARTAVTDQMALGALPAIPRCSIVVPLYGRLDYLTYQVALMSEHDMKDVELIYVLDEPERRSEFLTRARSAHMRYGVALRLVMPAVNLGFAGASNAGLNAATGEFVCFLNSDVMPAEAGWLDRMTGAIEADPDIGLIGARLLFEDSTLQHGGMLLKQLPAFGNFLYPMHPGKGRVPAPSASVRRVPLVTGACMVMRRSLAMQLGGFDTDYVIGDFEDVDLCMKVRAEGLACAVHDAAVLYHLERQSQSDGGGGWRQNLTSVNAWTFMNRWSGQIGPQDMVHA